MSARSTAAPEQWFSEIFPILTENLPELHAYRPVPVDGAERVIDRRTGTRLSARLRAKLGGYWFWQRGQLIADQQADPASLLLALDAARAESPDQFGAIALIEQDQGWSADPQTIADYVLRWPLAQLEADLQKALAATTFAIKDILVERQYQARPWVVADQPALSLTVTSRLLYESPLETYLTHLDKPTDLVGHNVVERTTSRSGEIVRVLGTVGALRTKLLAAASPALRPLIESAPDDHLALRIAIDESEIDTISDALWLVIRLDAIARFGLSAAQAEQALHLTPRLRAEIIRILSGVLKQAGLIGSAFSTVNAPDRFFSSASTPTLILGGGKMREFDPDRTPADVERFGVYQAGKEGGTLTLSVLNAHPDAAIVDDFLEALRRLAQRAFQVTIAIVRERKVRVPTPANLESGVRTLGKEAADLMLAFVPDEAAAAQSGFSEDALSERYIKAQTIGRRHACLLVSEALMNRPEALLQILLGIMGRAGVTPYALESPLPFADRVVGLHMHRLAQRSHALLIAMSRIYRADGVLLRWYASQVAVERDSPPPDRLLADVLPAALLAGKRVIVHHDGSPGHDALRALGEWEDQIRASFMPVAIYQQHIPRLYALRAGTIAAPPWGAALRLNEREALLNTTADPLQGDTTPQPLHVIAEAPLTIDQALQSIIALTLFHFGALSRPRLPVTLHHGDLIAAAWERGIFFENDSDQVLAGQTAFWL